MNKENQLSYRFNHFKVNNPNLGDYLVLSMAIRGMGYKRHQVYAAFNKYVPKSDYDTKERDLLMEKLEIVSLHGEKYGLVKPLEKSEITSLTK